MKKTTAIIVLLVFALTACKRSPSLDVFIVDHQELPEVVSFDIQGSMISDMGELTPNAKQALETLRKVNVLYFPVKEKNDSVKYQKDIRLLGEIFKNEKYQKLMSFSRSGVKMQIYLDGDEDKVDELILYGKSKEKGWALLRVLGDDMNPSAIMQALQQVDLENVLQASGAGDKIKPMLKGVMEGVEEESE